MLTDNPKAYFRMYSPSIQGLYRVVMIYGRNNKELRKKGKGQVSNIKMLPMNLNI